MILGPKPLNKVKAPITSEAPVPGNFPRGSESGGNWHKAPSCLSPRKQTKEPIEEDRIIKKSDKTLGCMDITEVTFIKATGVWKVRG